MKKFLFIILSTFLTPVAFSQNGDRMNTGTGVTRFENRKQEGYYNITQVALLMGNRPISEQNPNYYNDHSELQISPSVTMINGIMFNEQWAAGIGVGYEIFDRNLFPVFIDIRRTLWDSKVSPYFAVKMGYAFCGFKKTHYDNLSLDHEPYYINNAYYKKNCGLMVHPEIGAKIPLSENADLLFTVAYRHQKIKSTVKQELSIHRTWEYKANMNRLSFGVAVMFR